MPASPSDASPADAPLAPAVPLASGVPFAVGVPFEVGVPFGVGVPFAVGLPLAAGVVSLGGVGPLAGVSLGVDVPLAVGVPLAVDVPLAVGAPLGAGSSSAGAPVVDAPLDAPVFAPAAPCDAPCCGPLVGLAPPAGCGPLGGWVRRPGLVGVLASEPAAFVPAGASGAPASGAPPTAAPVPVSEGSPSGRWTGIETVPAAPGSASSAVGGRPMWRDGPGIRNVVVWSAADSSVAAESSAAPSSTSAEAGSLSNVSFGITPVASGSKGTSESSFPLGSGAPLPSPSSRTSEEPVIPVVMPSPSRCLTLTIMRSRTTPG